MSPDQLQAYSAIEAARVKVPYLVITGIFLFVVALIYFAKLPEIHETADAKGTEPREKNFADYGAETSFKGSARAILLCWRAGGRDKLHDSIRATRLPGTPERTAANYLWWHLFGFMVGRFAGSAMMKQIPAPRLLGVFAGGAFVCAVIAILATGAAPVWAVVLIGFFHSIMFPTIFALSLKNLGAYTKLGSSLLVMSIIGGAVFPA